MYFQLMFKREFSKDYRLILMMWSRHNEKIFINENINIFPSSMQFLSNDNCSS